MRTWLPDPARDVPVSRVPVRPSTGLPSLPFARPSRYASLGHAYVASTGRASPARKRPRRVTDQRPPQRGGQDRARQLQAGWVALVGGDNGAKDLTRVLRVPGTTNYKPDYAPDFPRVHFVRADLDRLYDLENLAALIPTPYSEARSHRTTHSGNPLGQAASAAKALERLSQARCDDYQSWIQVGMALSELGETGLALWRQWSQKSAKYEPGACAAKWETFTFNPIPHIIAFFCCSHMIPHTFRPLSSTSFGHSIPISENAYCSRTLTMVSDASRGIDEILFSGNRRNDRYMPPGGENHVLPSRPLPLVWR